MKARLTKEADDDLSRMDDSVRKLFLKHVEKILVMPPRRHLRFGLPFNVEDATRQARMVYQIDGETLWVIRCFANHKDYENWFRQFK